MTETAVEQLISQLRSQIISGKLKSGDKLREAELCARFNVSRTPLREAFRVLQSEGFLAHQPNVGVGVVSLTLKEYIELLEIRNHLELVAARHAVLHITDAQIQELDALNRRMWESGQDNPRSASDLDRSFHTLIAEAGKNETVLEYLTSIYQKSAMFRNLRPNARTRLLHTCDEHRSIVRALAERDVDMVTKYVDIHFYMSTKSATRKMRGYFESLMMDSDISFEENRT